jgi:hypothetical protein
MIPYGIRTHTEFIHELVVTRSRDSVNTPSRVQVQDRSRCRFQTNKFDTHKEMEIVLEVIFDLGSDNREAIGSESINRVQIDVFSRENDMDVTIGPNVVVLVLAAVVTKILDERSPLSSSWKAILSEESSHRSADGLHVVGTLTSIMLFLGLESCGS